MKTKEFIKKLIAIIAILFFANCCLHTNKSYKTLKSNLVNQWNNLSSISMDDNYKVLFTEYNEKIYIIEGVDSNIVQLNIIDKNNLIHKKLHLQEDNLINYINIKDMAITDQFIILLVSNDDNDYLYYYIISTFNFIKKRKLETNTYEHMFIKDSLFYFTQSYDYHPKDAENQSLIEMRKIDNLKVINKKILDIKGIEMTHFAPYRNIDFLRSNGLIIYSDLNSYNIKLLDKNLICLDSIEYLPKYWSKKYIDELQSISDSCSKIPAHNRMDYIRELLNTGLSKIYQIGFINDTTFYAAYYSGIKSDIDDHIAHWDIFSIRNNKIIKFQQGLTDIKNENYIPIVLSDNIPMFKNGKAYFFTYYDYNSIFKFLNMPEWIRNSLSLLTGSRIKMNLVVINIKGM